MLKIKVSEMCINFRYEFRATSFHLQLALIHTFASLFVPQRTENPIVRSICLR